MKKPILGKALAAATIAILLSGFLLYSRVRAAQEPGAAGSLPSTSQSDQSELSITVYNSDLALIRDVRDVSIPAGTFQLKFMDIAASLNPATVHFRSLSDPAALSVLEQNYEYDLLDPQKLLSKYVGRELTLNWGPTPVKATLLADNNGPIWKIGDQIVTGFQSSPMSFPKLPANLYDRPTLLWTLTNRGPAKQQKIETSYLATKLSWSADYVLTVNHDENAADLDGWVTLVNNSGTGFHNAKLQLVAGQLNRVRPEMQYKELDTLGRAATAAVPAPPFQQEAFSEYHLYTLTRPTSVLNSESKQISLLDAAGIPVLKTYEVNGQSYYYRNAMHPGAPVKDPVEVYYKFKNDEKSKLGMPLPAGTIRIYQADSRNNVLFAGEDHIDHTPKDEDLSLHMGDAFDVVAERKQTDYRALGGNFHEMEYEITLRNHKDVPITVEVNEPIGGDWEMINSTFPSKKTAAFAAQFSVPVAKDGAAVLRYRVRVHY
jgi:hypothetical protein